MLPTVRAGTLRVAIASHLLVDDAPLQRVEYLLALRERQPRRLECRFGADQIGNWLLMFCGGVRDGNEVDADSRHLRRCGPDTACVDREVRVPSYISDDGSRRMVRTRVPVQQ